MMFHNETEEDGDKEEEEEGDGEGEEKGEEEEETQAENKTAGTYALQFFTPLFPYAQKTLFRIFSQPIMINNSCIIFAAKLRTVFTSPFDTPIILFTNFSSDCISPGMD